MATVFWGTGILDGKSQTINIPVDSVSGIITFAFSADTKGSALKLTQPSGGAIAEGSADNEITDLNCGRIVTVNSPEPGEWRAEITGMGKYWLEVQAQSDIYFVRVEFVEKGGRPGHQGLFRIQGQPVSGASAMLQVSMSARATQSREFYLVGEQGQPIAKLQMRNVDPDPQLLEAVGNLELPDVPFRVAVFGRDSNGRQYQRFFPNLFHTESVQVSANPQIDELPAGSSQQIAFTVRNIGAPRTFDITVTDSRRFITGVAPGKLALGAGETGTVLVHLAVPPGTASAVEDNVILVAGSTAGPPTSNSGIARLEVSSSQSRP